MNKNSFISALFEKIKEKWIETLAIFFVGLIVSIVSFSYQSLSDLISAQQFENKRESILFDVKKVLGQGVERIEYDMNNDTGVTTILALHRGFDGAQITILTHLDGFITKVAEDKTRDFWTDGAVENFGFIKKKGLDGTYMYIERSVHAGTCCVEKTITIFDNNIQRTLFTRHNVPLDSQNVITIHEGKEDSNLILLSWVDSYLKASESPTEYSGVGHKEWERLNSYGNSDSELITVMSGLEFTEEGCTRDGKDFWLVNDGYTKTSSHFELIINTKQNESSEIVYVGRIGNESWSFHHGLILLSDTEVKLFITAQNSGTYMIFKESLTYNNNKFFHEASDIYGKVIIENKAFDDFTIPDSYFDDQDYTICSYELDEQANIVVNSTKSDTRNIIKMSRQIFN